MILKVENKENNSWNLYDLGEGSIEPNANSWAIVLMEDTYAIQKIEYYENNSFDGDIECSGNEIIPTNEVKSFVDVDYFKTKGFKDGDCIRSLLLNIKRGSKEEEERIVVPWGTEVFVMNKNGDTIDNLTKRYEIEDY